MTFLTNKMMPVCMLCLALIVPALVAVVPAADANSSPEALIYDHARLLDPALERFIAPDLLASTGSNAYSYADNSPAVLSDSSGMSPRSSPYDAIKEELRDPRVGGGPIPISMPPSHGYWQNLLWQNMPLQQRKLITREEAEVSPPDREMIVDVVIPKSEPSFPNTKAALPAESPAPFLAPAPPELALPMPGPGPASRSADAIPGMGFISGKPYMSLAPAVLVELCRLMPVCSTAIKKLMEKARESIDPFMHPCPLLPCPSPVGGQASEGPVTFGSPYPDRTGARPGSPNHANRDEAAFDESEDLRWWRENIWDKLRWAAEDKRQQWYIQHVLPLEYRTPNGGHMAAD